jgi:hypothetical protein
MHIRSTRISAVPQGTSSNIGPLEVNEKLNSNGQGDEEEEALPKPSLESRWLAVIILAGLVVINIRFVCEWKLMQCAME